MEKGFPILMLCFGGLMLVYAGLLAYVKDPSYIPHTNAAKIFNRERYASKFAGIIALVALAPLISGLVGLFTGPLVTAILLVVLLVLFIWLGTKKMKDVK